MTCPCCSAQLTEQQIKTIWGAYCNSKRTTPPKAGPGRGKKARPCIHCGHIPYYHVVTDDTGDCTRGSCDFQHLVTRVKCDCPGYEPRP